MLGASVGASVLPSHSHWGVFVRGALGVRMARHISPLHPQGQTSQTCESFLK